MKPCILIENCQEFEGPYCSFPQRLVLAAVAFIKDSQLSTKLHGVTFPQTVLISWST